MKADAYYNLHKHCISLRHKGKVVQHASYVEFTNPQFIVSQAGRQRVLAEKRKNVHAFVRGFVEFSLAKLLGEQNLTNCLDELGWRRVKYNPYKFSSFVLADSEQPVFSAASAIIINKNIFVLTPKLA